MTKPVKQCARRGNICQSPEAKAETEAERLALGELTALGGDRKELECVAARRPAKGEDRHLGTAKR